MPQQKDEFFPNWKQSTNFAFTFCTAYVRALTLLVRKNWGTQALGFPCLFAFGLMFLWYVATADPGMLVWMMIWLVSLVIRRMESVKLAGQVHSHYDGTPINLGSNEFLAKKIYEPICIGILGAILFWIYTDNGMSPRGLPCFVLGGVVALPFVETVKRQVWERRPQSMTDAKLEQEMLMEDFKNRR